MSKNKNSEAQIFWRMLLKNKLAIFGMVIIALIIFSAIFADILAPYDYTKQDLMAMKQIPSATHWFGTDEFGRDILSRIIFGTRQSLFIGVGSILIASVIGGGLGLISGYYGGHIDNLIMRVMDVMMAIPGMLLALAIVAALGTSMTNLLIAIAIAKLPNFARIMRASVLSTKKQEYVIASKVMGIPSRKIILEDILPNSMSPMIVQFTLGIAFAILTAAGLSFMGLGIQPPTPEWGAMISTAKNYIRDFPHMVIFPGAAIMITILALNLLGDGLRDALDPKLRY